MATPNWLAASAGATTLPGQVNQLLGQHTSAWLYAGTQKSAQTTGSGVYQTTQSQYLAQSFNTGVSQTAVGQLWLQVSTVGGSPVTATIPPLTVGLYASSNGSPIGAALGSVTLNEQYVYSSPFWVPVPLAVTGLSPSTTYQIVTFPVGSSSNYYVWQQSNQTSGASVSADGVTWTTKTYGLMYQVFDQTASASGDVLFFFDDGGARWVQLGYDSSDRLSSLTEYVTAQSATAPLQAARTFTYTNGFLTGVS